VVNACAGIRGLAGKRTFSAESDRERAFWLLFERRLPKELNGSVPSERYCKNDRKIQTSISWDVGDRRTREGFQLLFDSLPEKRGIS
jgi:hypothetical protein